MTLSRRLSCLRLPWIFAAVAGVVLLFPCPGRCAQTQAADAERFFRCVHVLQSISPEAAREEIPVPRKVRNSDATESLLHHPDRIFVLRSLARQLAELGAQIPEARLFEAYAQLELGNRPQAAELLMRYVPDAPYQERHYTLLGRALHASGDFLTLHLICREWGERDPTCNEERLLFLFAALFNTERYAEARDLMLGEGSCLGWQGLVYASRASLALEDAVRAEELLERARALPKVPPAQVEVLWERLGATVRF